MPRQIDIYIISQHIIMQLTKAPSFSRFIRAIVIILWNKFFRGILDPPSLSLSQNVNLQIEPFIIVHYENNILFSFRTHISQDNWSLQER